MHIHLQASRYWTVSAANPLPLIPIYLSVQCELLLLWTVELLVFTQAEMEKVIDDMKWVLKLLALHPSHCSFFFYCLFEVCHFQVVGVLLFIWCNRDLLHFLGLIAQLFNCRQSFLGVVTYVRFLSVPSIIMFCQTNWMFFFSFLW